MDNVFIENLIRLGMAVLVGGVIGAEREFQDNAAGFRTIILITIGSTLFTMFSVSMDPGFTRTRIAANIVTGIGFLGAGAIIREGGELRASPQPPRYGFLRRWAWELERVNLNFPALQL